MIIGGIIVKDGSPMTNVGDDEEDVLGDEVIFRAGPDSSAWPQNDNFSGNELMDGEDLVEAYGLGW
jgi:hypothetical protein